MLWHRRPPIQTLPTRARASSVAYRMRCLLHAAPPAAVCFAPRPAALCGSVGQRPDAEAAHEYPIDEPQRQLAQQLDEPRHVPKGEVARRAALQEGPHLRARAATAAAPAHVSSCTPRHPRLPAGDNTQAGTVNRRDRRHAGWRSAGARVPGRARTVRSANTSVGVELAVWDTMARSRIACSTGGGGRAGWGQRVLHGRRAWTCSTPGRVAQAGAVSWPGQLLAHNPKGHPTHTRPPPGPCPRT
jgi:hypothetical protein